MTVYLNNAATTFPKPPVVLEAVNRALAEPPVEPGRSGNGDDPLSACRKELAALLAVCDSNQVILTPSATFGLNMVLRGILENRATSHVVTTMLEHNAILRPLEHLARGRDVQVSWLEPDGEGQVSADQVAAHVRADTALVVVTHASNVTGVIQPIEAIARQAAEAGVPLLVDASQTAGVVELDIGRLPGRVFVAMAGHKGLFGPTGTGALIVPDNRLGQLIVGGTGVLSESELHPQELPLRHEAGTPNLPGLAGLVAGVRFVRQRGVQALGKHRHRLVSLCRERLSELPGIRLAPLANADGRAGIVAFTLEGWSPAELGFLLSNSFDIEVRTGLHCAPRIHRYLGTDPLGNVRVSVAAMNDAEDIDQLSEALESVLVPCRA